MHPLRQLQRDGLLSRRGTRRRPDCRLASRQRIILGGEFVLTYQLLSALTGLL